MDAEIHYHVCPHGTVSFVSSAVLLNPPVNLTVQNGSDFNLWFYWNQTMSGCVESQVRFRTNNKKWEVTQQPHPSPLSLPFTSTCLINHLSTDQQHHPWETRFLHQPAFKQLPL